MDLLKLAALDEKDLQVISAHLQDAVIRRDDMRYLDKEQRFVCVLNRFDWAGLNGRDRGKTDREKLRRARSGLDFSRVTHVRTKNVGGLDHDGQSPEILSLLAIAFTKHEAPSGVITLTFSGGGEIELTVECIEARLTDLGAAWTAQSLPEHDVLKGESDDR